MHAADCCHACRLMLHVLMHEQTPQSQHWNEDSLDTLPVGAHWEPVQDLIQVQHRHICKVWRPTDLLQHPEQVPKPPLCA